MNCRTARQKIALWVGNDLASSEVESVEEHVDECADCQRHVEELLSSSDVLVAFNADSIRAGKRDSIWPYLQDRLRTCENRFSVRDFGFRIAGVTAILAASFAVAILPDMTLSPRVSERATMKATPVAARPSNRSDLIRVYPDPSWQALERLDDAGPHGRVRARQVRHVIGY